MAELTTFRWRHTKLRADQIIVGRQTIVLDAEGFVETDKPLASDTEDRMRRDTAGFEYVPMNNDALWQGRMAASQARIDKARAVVSERERELIRAADMLRTCEEQHRALEAERARYQAAIDGVGPEPPSSERSAAALSDNGAKAPGLSSHSKKKG